jgi:hypothetical protein
MLTMLLTPLLMLVSLLCTSEPRKSLVKECVYRLS